MKRSISLLLSGATILSLFAVSAVPASAEESEKQGLTRDETLQIIDTKTQVKVESGSVSIVADGISTVAKLFDGNYDTKMEGNLIRNGNTATGTVSWEFSQPETLQYYVVYTANDTKTYSTRNPESWVLSGSNDKEDWTELDSVTNPNIEKVNYEAFGYEIENPGSYQYYKLELTKTDGNAFIQLGELELYTDDANADPHENPLAGDRRYVKTTYTTTIQNSCNFIDGNINTSVNIPTLLGITNDLASLDQDIYDEVLDNLTVYINNEEAQWNNSYIGYAHCKWTSTFGRLLLGIVGSGLKKDETYTVTILIGDNYYTDFTFTATANTLRILDSDTTYHTGSNTCVSVVTFADDNHGYTVDETVPSRIHDEHGTTLNFKVTEVNGSTVTFVCDNFTTTHSLLEMNQGNETKAFSIPIDHLTKTEEEIGYIQTRDAGDNKFDLRIVVEGNKDYLKQFDSASISATFTLPDSSTKTITPDDAVTVAYTSVIAAGEKYEASHNCGLFGIVITGIPYTEVTKVSVSVTYTKAGEEDTVVDLGSADLGTVTTKLPVADVKSIYTKYDSNKITVTSSTITDKNIGDNEGPDKLLDGLSSTKSGTGNSEFSITFTTESPITITGLIFTIANDSYTSNRTYAAWAIYGKNAAGDWILVAKSDTPITTGSSNVSESDPDEVANSNREAYAVQYAGCYSEYKIDIVGGSTVGYGSYNQMAELTLYTAAE